MEFVTHLPLTSLIPLLSRIQGYLGEYIPLRYWCEPHSSRHRDVSLRGINWTEVRSDNTCSSLILSMISSAGGQGGLWFTAWTSSPTQVSLALVFGGLTFSRALIQISGLEAMGTESNCFYSLNLIKCLRIACRGGVGESSLLQAYLSKTMN